MRVMWRAEHSPSERDGSTSSQSSARTICGALCSSWPRIFLEYTKQKNTDTKLDDGCVWLCRSVQALSYINNDSKQTLRGTSLASFELKNDQRHQQEERDPDDRGGKAQVHVLIQYAPAAGQDGPQRGGGQRQR